MIAIISAMNIENQAILDLCKNIQEKIISQKKFFEAELGDEKVVCCLSGTGKVNATISTTLLLEHFPIDAILNIGTAGGLKENQAVLDCVLSTRVVEHDYDTSKLDGEEGKGIYFNADPQLFNLVKRIGEEMKIPFHEGLIASGDQFISENEQIERILNDFPESMCAEMEAGAIAHVASHYGVPFVVLRSLSDITVKEGSEMDFVEYAQKASVRSAKLCEKVVMNFKRK